MNIQIPTPEEEIAIKAEMEANAYKESRNIIFSQVTLIPEQLDMLWHDIDEGLFGEQAKTGEFYSTIKSIKDNAPKPIQ